jgi:hypothetical protein
LQVVTVFEFFVAFLQVNASLIDCGPLLFGKCFENIFVFGTVLSKIAETDFFAKCFAGHNEKLDSYLVDVMIHEFLTGFILRVVEREESVVVSYNKEFLEPAIKKELRETVLNNFFLKYFWGNLGKHIGKFLVPFLQDHDNELIAYKPGPIRSLIIQTLSI